MLITINFILVVWEANDNFEDLSKTIFCKMSINDKELDKSKLSDIADVIMGQ